MHSKPTFYIKRSTLTQLQEALYVVNSEFLTGYISMCSSKDEQFAEDFTPNYSISAASRIRSTRLHMSKKRYKEKNPHLKKHDVTV